MLIQLLEVENVFEKSQFHRKTQHGENAETSLLRLFYYDLMAYLKTQIEPSIFVFWLFEQRNRILHTQKHKKMHKTKNVNFR